MAVISRKVSFPFALLICKDYLRIVICETDNEVMELIADSIKENGVPTIGFSSGGFLGSHYSYERVTLAQHKLLKLKP